MTYKFQLQIYETREGWVKQIDYLSKWGHDIYVKEFSKELLVLCKSKLYKHKNSKW